MRLTVHAEGPAIDLDRFVRAIPLLLDRARAVEFAYDGRAVLSDRPADRLRIVDGTPGLPGSAYRVVGDDSEETTVTVTRDDTEAIEVELNTGGVRGAGSGSAGAGMITVEQPAEAARAQFSGVMTVDEAPRVVGSRWDVAGQVRLADWQTGTEPQLTMQLDGRLGSARSTARVERSSGGPGPIGAEAELWTVTLEIEMHPRGIARLASLALPLMRRRVTAVIAEQITRTLVETADQIAQDFDPDDGPDEIADRAWAIIVADLTTPVAG